jgi:hypothetical protein
MAKLHDEFMRIKVLIRAPPRRLAAAVIFIAVSDDCFVSATHETCTTIACAHFRGRAGFIHCAS